MLTVCVGLDSSIHAESGPKIDQETRVATGSNMQRADFRGMPKFELSNQTIRVSIEVDNRKS